MKHARSLFVVPVLLFTSTASAQVVEPTVDRLPLQPAETWVVEASGGGDFETIQEAVDAASSGDTIVLGRPDFLTGRYDAFVVDGKGLTIVGPEFPRATTGPIVVRDVPLGETVVLSRLDASARDGVELEPFLDRSGLLIEDCLGAVRVQSASFEGGYGCYSCGLGSYTGTDGVTVRDSADVVLTSCDLRSGNGTLPAIPGAALRVEGSSVRFHGGTLTGEHGVAGYGEDDGGAGGHGAVLQSGVLYITASTVRGGWGGDTVDIGISTQVEPATGQTGDGGHGLVIDALSTALGAGLDIEPGYQGTPGLFSTYGAPGEAIVGVLDPVFPVDTGLDAPTRVEAGDPIEVAVIGIPGKEVELFVGRGTTTVLTPNGTLHLPAARVVPLGTVPPSGQLSATIVAPDASGGTLDLYLQTSSTGPLGNESLGPVRQVTVVRPGELFTGGRLFVDSAAPVGGDGASWTTAFRNLNDALARVGFDPDEPTEVWLAEGEYRPAPGSGPIGGFFVRGGTRLYGGFAPGATSLDERDPVAHPVVLSGDVLGDDLPGFANRDDNVLHTVWIGSPAQPQRGVRIEGVTVRGGHARFEFGYPSESGGGIYSVARDVHIVRTVVEDNQADEDGGGIMAETYGPVWITNSFVRSNVGFNAGGIMGELGSELRVVNSVIAGNTATNRAGGAWLEDEARMRNSLVYGNVSNIQPAGIRIGSSTVHVRNSIIWKNRYDDGSLGLSFTGSDANMTDSLVQGYAGSQAGVLDTAPKLVDPKGPDGVFGTPDDDYRLQSTSPAIDAGNGNSVAADGSDLDGDGDVMEKTPVDLDENPRFTDDPDVPDTGNGFPPVDIGPYERP